jgi:hypothetical protein
MFHLNTYSTAWRNLKNNVLSSLLKLLRNRLEGAGSTPPPPLHPLHYKYKRIGNGRFLAYILSFYHDGKISLSWRGREVHTYPFSQYLPSRTKLQCTLWLKGRYCTLPLFHLYPYVLCATHTYTH